MSRLHGGAPSATPRRVAKRPFSTWHPPCFFEAMFIPGAQTEVASLPSPSQVDRNRRPAGQAELKEGRSFADELDEVDAAREAPATPEARERTVEDTPTEEESSVGTTNREASPAGGAESEAPAEGVELDPNSDQVIPVAGALPGHSQPLDDTPLVAPGLSTVTPVAPAGAEGPSEAPGSEPAALQPGLAPQAAAEVGSAAAPAVASAVAPSVEGKTPKTPANPEGAAGPAGATGAIEGTATQGAEAQAPTPPAAAADAQGDGAQGELAQGEARGAEPGSAEAAPKQVQPQRGAAESRSHQNASPEVNPNASQDTPSEVATPKPDAGPVAPTPVAADPSAATAAPASPTAPVTAADKSTSVTGAAAAAPTNTPAPVSPEDASSVLHQIRVHLARGSSRATLNLHPSELGRVSIQISMNGSKLAAVVVAETPEAVAMLDHQLPELRSTLSQNGIEAESLEVQLGFQNEGNDAQRSHSRDASHRDGRRSVLAQVEIPEEIAGPRPSTVTDTYVDTLA